VGKSSEGKERQFVHRLGSVNGLQKIRRLDGNLGSELGHS